MEKYNDCCITSSEFATLRTYRQLEHYLKSRYLNRYCKELILYLEWKRSLEHINEYWYGKYLTDSRLYGVCLVWTPETFKGSTKYCI